MLLSRISRAFAAGSLLWCLVAGCLIYTTPIPYTVVQGTADSARQVAERAQVVYRSFSEVSEFGIRPLLIPVLLSTIATWAAYRAKHLALVGITLAFLAFTVVTGFSIGRAYLPSALMLIGAVVLELLSAIAGRRHKAAV